MTDLTIPVVFIGLFAVFSFLFAYILVKIFRLPFRWLRWSARASNVSAKINFICFAVAAYLFPAPLKYILSATWQLINALISYLPSRIQELLSLLRANCSTSIWTDQCLQDMATKLWFTWNLFVSSILSQLNLGNFPLMDAIVLTAVWFGLVGTFELASSGSRARRLAEALHSSMRYVARRLTSISMATRSNMIFFLIVTIGAYLSLTAVVAIPSLDEPVVHENALTAELLSKNLRKMAQASVEFDTRFPMAISKDERFDNSVLFTEATAEPTSSARFWANNLKQRLERLIAAWNALKDGFRAQQSEIIDEASEIFDLSNRGRKGIRETQQHFLNIELWYRRWWASRAAQLEQCKSAIEHFNSDAVSQFSWFVQALKTTEPQLQPVLFQVFNDAIKKLDQSDREAVEICAGKTEASKIPEREDFGGYLGIFGLVAKWLLKTESQSLVMITGLLGFGLLGAACSTLIRSTVKRRVTRQSRGRPLVPNLASVVIRGASAAILVFLGVYGGLAVFAGAKATPNPYVVLFTCLVAAVFSEDAWAWGAREWQSRFSGKSRGQNRRTQRAFATARRNSTRRRTR
jgi:hypothetical protein